MFEYLQLRWFQKIILYKTAKNILANKALAVGFNITLCLGSIKQTMLYVKPCNKWVIYTELYENNHFGAKTLPCSMEISIIVRDVIMR